MPVDINDTSKPIQTSPTAELTAELRAIKAKCKTLATDLQSLLTQVGAISNMTEFGGQLLALPDENALHDVLGASAQGLAFYQEETPVPLLEILGVKGSYNYPTGLVFGTNLGSIQIRWGSQTLSGGQSGITATTFPTACVGGVCVHHNQTNAGGNGPMRCAPDGASLKLANPESSPRQVGWIAIGY